MSASAQDWVARGVCTATNLEGVAFSDAQNAFVVGQGYILRSRDGGSSWAPLLAVGTILHDVGFRDGSLGLAVGDGGLVLRTTDGGQSWNAVESGTTADLRTVALGDGGVAIAAGFGVALRSPDGGATWEIVDAGDISFLGSATAGTRAWLVGEGGVVRFTNDGGSSWASQSSGTTEDLRAAFFVTPSRGWVAGAGGTLLYTEDGGSTWLPRAVGVAVPLNALHFVSASTGWVVGGGGVILRTQDAGLSWSAESSFNVDELLDVVFSTAGQGCAVGVVCTVLLRESLVTGVIDASRAPRPVVRAQENPSRGVAIIHFGLPRDANVRIGVFDAQGRLVASLVRGRFSAGWHEAEWDARGLAPGVYLARLTAETATASTKFVLGR